jgi:hypothetical protein
MSTKKLQIIGSSLMTSRLHIRYSAYADGTDFTEEWSAGQNYIGFATASEAPTDKSEYEWSLFASNIRETITVTLAAGNWAVNKQTITTSAIGDNTTVFNTPHPDSKDSYISAGIMITSATSTSLTFTCTTVPTVDIAVEVMLIDPLVGTDSTGCEVIEVASFDELPDDAKDGTIAVIPNGVLPSGGSGGVYLNVTFEGELNEGRYEYDYGIMLDNELVLTSGTKYKVVYDGTEYKCECISIGNNQYIGNGSMIGYEDTGEPFLVWLSSDFIFVTEAGEHTLKICDVEKSALPEITEGDAGKVLTVNEDGAVEWKEPTGGLPEVTEADNGKFLQVVDGAIALVALQDVSKEGM